MLSKINRAKGFQVNGYFGYTAEYFQRFFCAYQKKHRNAILLHFQNGIAHCTLQTFFFFAINIIQLQQSL